MNKSYSVSVRGLLSAMLLGLIVLQAGCATPVGEVESWPITNWSMCCVSLVENVHKNVVKVDAS